MEIGGIDILLSSKAGNESIKIAIDIIKQFWTEAIFENGNTGEKLSQIPSDIKELFVYKNNKFAELWEKEIVLNTMIYLIYDKDLLTVVIDGKDTEINEIIGLIGEKINE